MTSKSSQAKYRADDGTSCRIIGISIADIIRSSLNEEFRKKSFELLSAQSTKEVEEKVCSKLGCIVGTKVLSLDSRNTKSGKETSKYSEMQSPVVFSSNTIAPSSHGSENPQSNNFNTLLTQLPPETFEKNWLEMSSQKYKESKKQFDIELSKGEYTNALPLNETNISNRIPKNIVNSNSRTAIFCNEFSLHTDSNNHLNTLSKSQFLKFLGQERTDFKENLHLYENK